MGVINVTPDSFSDGGAYFDRERAGGIRVAIASGWRRHHRYRRRINTAGRQSSSSRDKLRNKCCIRAARFKEASGQRKRRIGPRNPCDRSSQTKAPAGGDLGGHVQGQCGACGVEAGAEIVNDVSGFRWDAQMLKTLAELKCGAVLMHMRGRPEEWRTLPPVSDIVVLVNGNCGPGPTPRIWRREAGADRA